jgi:hypothetical protein
VFDRVFGPHSSQEDVFENSGIKLLAEKALEG